MLLGFLCLTHLGVLFSLFLSHGALAYVTPVAFVLAIFSGDRLGVREGLSGRARLWPLALTLVMTGLSVMISGLFFDLSWDGQWYHQTGIYHIAKDWNPLTEPMREFAGHVQDAVRHYSKGPWYIASSMMSLTGDVEHGKYMNWLALFAALMAVLAASLDAGIRRAPAIAIATLVALNPVVTSEVFSFLVDGLMVSYLAICAAAVVSGIRRPGRMVIYVGTAAMILSINSKFTGLVFLCFICAAAGLYCLIRRRDILWKFVLVNAIALSLGTFVFGFNPYVTNIVHRSHPFYPLMGTEAHPSNAMRDNDQIELYETPHNMMGKNRFVRFGYAIFGRPGAQPFNNERNSHLEWPFQSAVKHWSMYRFHETRVAGFGPLFSGILLLSLGLLGWLIYKQKTPGLVLFLAYLAIISSLLISKHTWWARYGPQLWWLPILPLILAFRQSGTGVRQKAAWGFVAIFLLNSLIVAGVHLNWEIKSTGTVNKQMAEFRESGKTIELDMRWFDVAVGERFSRWEIPYESIGTGRLFSNLEGMGMQELKSVVVGYPGGVYYRYKKD